ncbi:MAG: hypothetical protein OXG11_06810 [Chloroflexi bacterium]|nr:hypothetical protein [Chloroflexota bacterium]
MAGRSDLTVIPEPEEDSASRNDRLQEALETVLAWAEAEGLESPSLEAARPLLEELNRDPTGHR